MNDSALPGLKIELKMVYLSQPTRPRLCRPPCLAYLLFNFIRYGDTSFAMGRSQRSRVRTLATRYLSFWSWQGAAPSLTPLHFLIFSPFVHSFWMEGDKRASVNFTLGKLGGFLLFSDCNFLVFLFSQRSSNLYASLSAKREMGQLYCSGSAVSLDESAVEICGPNRDAS